MLWDVFCRVIDNFGDIGVCWRLARDLAARGEQVRLWVDDASALAWMAPSGAVGVTVVPWSSPPADLAPGQVVIEAFGCELPPLFVERMTNASDRPVWVNLEYLSAESYVERSHRLPSPQRNGLTKWFFYPGFTAATGGLLREPGRINHLHSFDAESARDAWIKRWVGVERRADERVVSLFCYDNPMIAALLSTLREQPTLLLLAGPQAQRQVLDEAPAGSRGGDRPGQEGPVRAIGMPALTQDVYDELLAVCDLNFVRGEDSFVRAQWAGRPFVWQIYPQHDDAHAAKLDAFLALHLNSAAPELAAGVRQLFRSWNGWPTRQRLELPPLAPWQAQVRQWRAHLLQQLDLTGQLIEFVLDRRPEPQ